MIGGALVFVAVVILLFLEESGAAAADSGAGSSAGSYYEFPAPPADLFTNAELGDPILGGSGMPVTFQKINLLAGAIATAEGEYNPDPNVIPRRAHNPGDLTRSFGQTTTGIANSEGVLVFADDNAGWSALKAEVTAMLTGASHVYSPKMSIYQVADLYTGHDPQASTWAQTVADALGIAPDQTLADFLAA